LSDPYTQINKYAGRCYYCMNRVAAEHGIAERRYGESHRWRVYHQYCHDQRRGNIQVFTQTIKTTSQLPTFDDFDKIDLFVKTLEEKKRLQQADLEKFVPPEPAPRFYWLPNRTQVAALFIFFTAYAATLILYVGA